MTFKIKLFELPDKKKENFEDKPSLLNLPSDIIRFVGSLLDIKSKGQYSKTAKMIHNFFQPDLEKEAGTFIAVALHYAAFGKLRELDALLANRPGLVYKRGATFDPSGRKVNGTVYRIALGAKDWSPYPDQFEEMSEMIERHMKRLPNGKNEIELQRAEQFPEDWEVQEQVRQSKDSAALREVFQAIDQSETEADCKEAIDKFINHLKSHKEISTGFYFNDELLSEAYHLYGANYNKFVSFDCHKNRLASIKVIGGIQSHMTACLAMAHCDSLSVSEQKSPLNRNMNLDDGTPFFSTKLGCSHLIFNYYGGVWRARSAAAPLQFFGEWPHVFQNLVRIKSESFRQRQHCALKKSETEQPLLCIPL